LASYSAWPLSGLAQDNGNHHTLYLFAGGYGSMYEI
jgi:hypothetical protein